MVDLPDDDLTGLESLDPATQDALLAIYGEGEDVLDMDGSDEHTANLANYISEMELTRIAQNLVEQVEQDEESRQPWISRLIRGIEELGFDRDNDARDDPFPGASNVVHPLFAMNTVEFQASAMKEMCPSQGPVRTRIYGNITPQKEQKSARIREHMNYQLTVEIPEYRETTGILTMQLPIAGSVFRKTIWNRRFGRVGYQYIRCDDLIVAYGATDIDSAPRVTHRMFPTENELRRDMRDGFYRDIDLPSPGDPEYSELTMALDKAQGVMKPSDNQDNRYTILEVYCELDLPGFEDVGEDGEPTGVMLPYVVTINKDNNRILAIYRGWDPDDDLKRPIRPIAHYKYRPWDGFYGVGLFHLIGGLSKTATGCLRALLDSAMLANIQGGFRLKGGRKGGETIVFSPGEWQEVEAEFLGQDPDIRKLIMPYPLKGPDPTLYELLQFIVNAGQAFASITAQILQDANPNSPVGTTLALIEQAGRVYSAIHADLHAVQGRELQMMHRFNGMYLDDERTVKTFGGEMIISRQDYDSEVDVVPVSDPNIFSDAQRYAQLQAVRQLRAEFPGKMNDDTILQSSLLALRLPNPESYILQPPQAQPMDPVSEFGALIKGMPVDAFPGQDHLAHAQYLQAIGNDPQYAMVIPSIGPRLQALIAAHLALQARDEAMAKVSEYLDGLVMSDQQLNQQDLLKMASQIMAQYQQQATAARVAQQQQAMQQQMQPEGDLLGKAALADVQRKAAADVQEAQAKAAEIEAKAARDAAEGDTKLVIEREKIAAENMRHAETIIAEDERQLRDLEAKIVVAAMSDKNQQAVTGPVGRTDQDPTDGHMENGNG